MVKLKQGPPCEYQRVSFISIQCILPVSFLGPLAFFFFFRPLFPMNQMHMDPSSSKEPVIKNKPFDEEEHDSADDSDSEKPAKRSGRRKIKIEYIEDKNRRHITFSKRKAGIMKKVFVYWCVVYRHGLLICACRPMN